MKVTTRLKHNSKPFNPVYVVSLALDDGTVYTCESTNEHAGENKCFALARKAAKKGKVKRHDIQN